MKPENDREKLAGRLVAEEDGVSKAVEARYRALVRACVHDPLVAAGFVRRGNKWFPLRDDLERQLEVQRRTGDRGDRVEFTLNLFGGDPPPWYSPIRLGMFELNGMVRIGELLERDAGDRKFEAHRFLRAGDVWWSVRPESVLVGPLGWEAYEEGSGWLEPPPDRPRPGHDDDGVVLRQVVTDVAIPYLERTSSGKSARESASGLGAATLEIVLPYEPEVLIEERSDEHADATRYLISFDDETASDRSDLIDDCVAICRRRVGVRDAVRYEREQIWLTADVALSAKEVAELQWLLTDYLRRESEEGGET